MGVAKTEMGGQVEEVDGLYREIGNKDQHRYMVGKVREIDS
jgi:hypothetical protein